MAQQLFVPRKAPEWLHQWHLHRRGEMGRTKWGIGMKGAVSTGQWDRRGDEIGHDSLGRDSAILDDWWKWLKWLGALPELPRECLSRVRGFGVASAREEICLYSDGSFANCSDSSKWPQRRHCRHPLNHGLSIMNPYQLVISLNKWSNFPRRTVTAFGVRLQTSSGDTTKYETAWFKRKFRNIGALRGIRLPLRVGCCAFPWRFWFNQDIANNRILDVSFNYKPHSPFSE
jgi:hypothetical protein